MYLCTVSFHEQYGSGLNYFQVSGITKSICLELAFERLIDVCDKGAISNLRLVFKYKELEVA